MAHIVAEVSSLWTSHSKENSESWLTHPFTSRTGLDLKPCRPRSMRTGHGALGWSTEAQRLELFMEATGGTEGPVEL